MSCANGFKTKTFEVRDKGTFIPCIGIAIYGRHTLQNEHTPNELDLYLARRAGYEERCILFTRMNGDGRIYYDPTYWNDRTMFAAHRYITENWKDLKSGQVIDVEFILGETKEPKKSESYGQTFY